MILRQAVSNDYISDDLLGGTQVGIIRFILVGVALILLMVFRPQGSSATRRRWPSVSDD